MRVLVEFRIDRPLVASPYSVEHPVFHELRQSFERRQVFRRKVRPVVVGRPVQTRPSLRVGQGGFGPGIDMPHSDIVEPVPRSARVAIEDELRDRPASLGVDGALGKTRDRHLDGFPRELRRLVEEYRDVFVA